MSARHANVLIALFAFALGPALISVVRGSLLGVVSSVAFGIVLLFVMGIAWSRFRGESPEHHAPSDRFLDDTEP